MGNCKQINCTVATDGKCLEGLEIKSCPHYIDDFSKNTNEEELEEEYGEDDEQPLRTEFVGSFVDIYSGESLQINEIYPITFSERTKLVLLGGPSDSGKTTFLTSLYDCFQKNIFDNLKFAGSKTLLGFEKRCFPSRTSSKRLSSDTERTKLLPPEFLHLKIIDKNGSNIISNFLFSDISGEKFRLLKDSVEESGKYELINWADNFVLFFDCELLSKLASRQSAKFNSMMLLRSLTEAKKLNETSIVDVVFSKIDLIKLDADANSHMLFIDQIKEDIISNYSQLFKKLNFHEIASRPKVESNLGLGYGIQPLVEKWLADNENIEFKPSNTVSSQINIRREFSKYTSN